MSDLDNEIRDLREKTDQNRRQFLLADVELCFIAIERAKLELSLGKTDEARKEYLIASRGADVIERFLREAAAEKVADIKPKLRDLRSSLKSLRAELGTTAD